MNPVEIINAILKNISLSVANLWDLQEASKEVLEAQKAQHEHRCQEALEMAFKEAPTSLLMSIPPATPEPTLIQQCATLLSIIPG